MSRGYFYPQPPTFIGGRQPFAPALGQPQSGPTLSAPPPRTLAVLGVIISAWAPKPYALPPQADIAPIITVAVASQPPPPNRQWLGTVLDSYKDRQWTLIYVASIAPILSVPEVVDNPPPNSRAAFNSILSQWKAVPSTPPQLKGAAAFSVTVTPDNPPPSSYANLNLIRAQWEPRKWWPLPENIDQVPQSGAIADSPPPTSSANLNVIRAQWQQRYVPAQGYGDIAPLIAAQDVPPYIDRQTLRVIIDSWKAPAYQVSMRGSAADFTQPIAINPPTDGKRRLSVGSRRRTVRIPGKLN